MIPIPRGKYTWVNSELTSGSDAACRFCVGNLNAMNIQSSSFKNNTIAYNRTAAKQPASQSTESVPQDSFTFGIGANDVKAAAILGGLGLAGVAMGAAAGRFEGVLAGAAGAVAGASAGASLAVHLPGEKIKTGMFLGAMTGAITAASFGNTAAAVAFGVAGASLPYGAVIGLASAIGGG